MVDRRGSKAPSIPRSRLRVDTDANCGIQFHQEILPMSSYTVVIERWPDAGLYVGYVPCFSGAHSQGDSTNPQ